MFRAGFEPYSLSGLVIQLPDLLALRDGRIQNNVGVPMFRRPDNGLTTDDARNPYARMRLLQRQHPRIHHTQVIMIALPTKWSWLSPRFNNHIVRFVKSLAVESGIGVSRQRFHATATNEAGNQASFRN